MAGMIRGLTLRHPWPAMFLLDEAPKRIENRDWIPPRALIGQFIALHGGRLPKTPAEFREVREALDWVNDIVWDGDEESAEVLGQQELLQLCTAGIFAVARLSEVVSSSRDPGSSVTTAGC